MASVPDAFTPNRAGHNKHQGSSIDMRAESWSYVNDGNANIVFSNSRRPSQVLRIRKSLLHAAAEKDIERLRKEYIASYGYASSILRPIIGNEYGCVMASSFLNFILSSFWSSSVLNKKPLNEESNVTVWRYVHQLVSIPRSFGLALARNARPLRPKNRIGEEGLPPPESSSPESNWMLPATLATNVLHSTFNGASSPSPSSSSPPPSHALCIELKPKWGYVPSVRCFPTPSSNGASDDGAKGIDKDAQERSYSQSVEQKNLKTSMCRKTAIGDGGRGRRSTAMVARKLVRGTCQFCLLQPEKLRVKKVKQLSSFCPLSIYSEDEERIQHAIDSLLDTPQNNLQLFAIHSHPGHLLPSSSSSASSPPSAFSRIDIKEEPLLRQCVARVARGAKRERAGERGADSKGNNGQDDRNSDACGGRWEKYNVVVPAVAKKSVKRSARHGAKGIRRVFEAVLHKDMKGSISTLEARIRDRIQSTKLREGILGHFAVALKEDRKEVPVCARITEDWWRRSIKGEEEEEEEGQREDEEEEEKGEGGEEGNDVATKDSSSYDTARRLDILCKYLLSRTLRDVSIMLTVLPGAGQRDNMSTEKNDDEKIATTPRQHGNSLPPPTSPSCPDDSLRGVNITVEGKCYVVQIAVVDLDRKAVAKASWN
eukprot:jgi/Bigna1/74266/fgenesh1_pg.28_\